MPENKQENAGVSIRALILLLIVTALLYIAFSLFELQHTAAQSSALYELEQDRHNCDVAIQQLMDGSDYLTSQVQQFVIKMDRVYMDNYWNEVYVTKTRDNALQAILQSDITPGERSMAQAGKDESDALIRGEIWSMRMISESIGISLGDMPEEVAAYTLPEKDAQLSAEEKQESAIAYVFGPEYSLSKELIRGNVNSFRNEISNRYAAQAVESVEATRHTIHIMAIGLMVFCVFSICAIVYFTLMVVSPLVRFSKVLAGCGDDVFAVLKEEGALEIRQFAAAFNALSSQVELKAKRLERMGYVDYLTDVPNRAGITECVTELIETRSFPLGVMMIDIDNFKRFNDTYGHALGDVVLQRVAKAVCYAQPEGSGIAGRLCGEEFVVAVRGVDEKGLEELARSILARVRSITENDVNMPQLKDFHITVSIGGMLWNGELPADFTLLLSKADSALYVSKGAGKDRYTLYTAEK